MTPGRTARIALSLAAIPPLGLFYVRYVPLVKSFQTAFIPILLTAVVLTLIRPVWGTLFFIFAFPLINNLPYFFGLAEPLPLAPTALVLGLFYLWASLLRGTMTGQILPRAHPIFKPMAVLAGLVTVSALITFIRYSVFFPVLSDRIYELTTNWHRVSSGGAIMSVVFTALSYLTGLGVFIGVITSLNSRAKIRMAIGILGISTCLSLLFALYQRLLDPKFGNNPISIGQALINGTFKDAMSFGAYLAIAAPVFLGAVFWFRKSQRILCLGLVGLSGLMIIFTGSRSGLLALVSALVFFGIMLAFRVVRPGDGLDKKRQRRKRPRVVSWAVGLIIVGCVAWVANSHKEIIVKAISGSRSVARLKSLGSNFSLKNIYGRGDSLWLLAGAMIRDYPITGVGIGGFIIEMSNYAADRKIDVSTPESAENLPLQIGSELGLVGLLIAAWIFWEIGRKIVSQWKALAAVPRDRFLLLGLAGGLFSFVLISQVHTFIWSYEIHYTFWLVVALVYGLGRDGASVPGESKPGLPVRKSFARRAVFPVVLLVFAAVHLWNSTHSLSLESRAAKYGFKQDFGFYRQEKTPDGRDFRWTGKHAGTELLVEKTRLEVPLMASHPDIATRPVKVSVFLVRRFFKEKRLLGELTIGNSDWRTYEFALAPEDVGKSAVILIKVDRTWVPQKALGVPDPRHLGIGVGPIHFKE